MSRPIIEVESLSKRRLGQFNARTMREEAERFPYRPSRIVDSVADLVDEL